MPRGLHYSEAEYAAYLRQRGTPEAQPVSRMQPVARPILPSKLPIYRSKTEARYAQTLETLKYCGQITDYWYEGIKLRLAAATFYTPDFLVLLPDRSLECVEIKGFWREDARVKIKVAARQYPCFTFRALQWVKGAWKEEQF